MCSETGFEDEAASDTTQSQMRSNFCTVRQYRASDFDGYVRLHSRAAGSSQVGRCTSPQALAEGLSYPGFSPERDLFVAEAADGEIVGCIDVRPELDIGRAVITYLVHPAHHAGDMATQLFDSALRRASSMGARLAHVSVSEDDAAARGLLSGLGFTPARRFLEMSLALPGSSMGSPNRAEYRCRQFQPGDEARLAVLQNRSFEGSWGFHPNTAEEIAHRVNLSDSRPEGIVFICDEGRPVGYCWTTVSPDEDTASGVRKGRIHMMGTDPDHRGKGIGRAALLAGISYLQSRGLEVAELTVDSQNSEARSLYESVGFKVWATSTWYEKALG